MMKNSYMHVLIASLLVLVALGGYWYASHELGDASTRSAELLADVAAKRAAREANENAADALSHAEAERAAIRGYFVSSDGIVSFLESLEDTGGRFGADVEVVSVSEVQTPRPHLSIALSMDGSFSSVMRTLGVIEYGPRDVEVSALTLNANASEEAAGTWTATVNLSVGTASSTTP